MTIFHRRASGPTFILALAIAAPCLTFAQQDAAAAPLEVTTTTLPRAYARQPYEAQLGVRGGSAPYMWRVSEGELPAGVRLGHDGILTGTPAEAGQFRFTVTVTDSGRPAYERTQDLILVVVAPLLAEWGKYPAVNGQRIEGSVRVSNQTERDFDLTVIIVAVNEYGRATALGYQRFTLKKGATEVEIPFGENLPAGAYEINVDAVAEVAATNSIYRARLAPKEKLRIQQGP